MQDLTLVHSVSYKPLALNWESIELSLSQIAVLRVLKAQWRVKSSIKANITYRITRRFNLKI